MKTVDLIPFILLELKENDKYGFELTKSIETKSNGKIVIKQPTLYTVLKKLEKSKFISSYWQDSEIGGKRHYYKITENGLKQTTTLPSYESLLKDVCGEDFIFVEPKQESASIKPHLTTEPVKESSFSIFDHLSDESPDNTEEIESILPSSEVFSNENLDNSTDFEINKSNTDFLKTEEINNEEKFANNKGVSKFIETVSTEVPKEIIKQTETVSIEPNDILNCSNYSVDLDKIEYVDYVDLKKDENYTYSKKAIKNLTLRVLTTSAYLLFMIIMCSVITSFTGRTKMFYGSLILSVVALLFVPTIFTYKYKTIKNNLITKKININIKKQLFLCLAIELIIIIACIVLNIIFKNYSILTIFKLSNFSNIYAPILLSSTLFFDLCMTKIFLINKLK